MATNRLRQFTGFRLFRQLAETANRFAVCASPQSTPGTRDKNIEVAQSQEQPFAMRPSLRIFTTSMMLRHHYQTVIRVLQVALIAISLVRPACAETSATSEPWYARVSERLESTWNNGQTELYVPLHVHHMRFAYTREKINSFNETPWGLGIGRGVYDADGDWHGLYVMEFQDSHYKPEYLAGYGYKTFWPLRDELKFGLGYVAFVTARTDIGHYTPIAAALPTLTLEYQKYSLETVYVPGGNGKGNILLFWGKVHF